MRNLIREIKNSFIQLIFSIIFLLLPNAGYANSYSAIDYTLKLSKSIIPAITIEAEIKGTLSNQLIINLPSHWAGANYFKQLKNVKLIDCDFKFSVTQGTDPQIVIDIPRQVHSLKISYELHQKNGDPSNVREIIIRKDLIHSTGYGLFAVPDDAHIKDILGFSVKWKEMPSNWKSLSSHGAGASLLFT